MEIHKAGVACTDFNRWGQETVPFEARLQALLEGAFTEKLSAHRAEALFKALIEM